MLEGNSSRFWNMKLLSLMLDWPFMFLIVSERLLFLMRRRIFDFGVW